MTRASGGVMAQSAGLTVEGDDAQSALFRKLEFFPTPPWAARAGGEVIRRLDPDARVIWEPCCGQGHMAGPLSEDFAVSATDIHAHGWAGQSAVIDFTAPDADCGIDVDWIVTNPPFTLAADFVRLGLQRARRGVALLCRLSLLESAARYPLFFGDTPLTALAPFFERVPMQLGVWDPKGSTATAYAWFVWMTPDVRERHHAHLHPVLCTTSPVIMPIPPGSKARLTRPDDARLFGWVRPAPLWDSPFFTDPRPDEETP